MIHNFRNLLGEPEQDIRLRKGVLLELAKAYVSDFVLTYLIDGTDNDPYIVKSIRHYVTTKSSYGYECDIATQDEIITTLTLVERFWQTVAMLGYDLTMQAVLGVAYDRRNEKLNERNLTHE